jgi:phosphoglycerate dehydrogenase-like enzyme
MIHPTVILHTDNTAEAMGIIAAAHPDLTLHGCDSHAALPGLIAETGTEVVYSVRFANSQPFPRAALMADGPVRWVSVGGSGIDHLVPWDMDRVTVTNAAGVAADMMAEYVLGTYLSFTLNLARFRTLQAERRWIPDGSVSPAMGGTVLILGLGKTGQAVARRMQAMGLTVLGVRARPQDTPHCDEVHGIDALPALWPRADLVVACVPLLDSTRGLVGRAAFGAMKDSAVVVDVSRGGVIDEAALIAALGSGAIRGAALDVFATEPLPANNPLWALENVIITPHCSSVDAGWSARSVRMFADNLERYRRGETLTNIVDPARGY